MLKVGWMWKMGSDAFYLEDKIGGVEMEKQTYNGQTFLECANEAMSKIREIYHIFGGYEDQRPEEDTLLGDTYDCISDMISLYLAPMTGKELHSDELNNMTVEIEYADKDEIEGIIKKYCGASI